MSLFGFGSKVDIPASVAGFPSDLKLGFPKNQHATVGSVVGRSSPAKKRPTGSALPRALVQRSTHEKKRAGPARSKTLSRVSRRPKHFRHLIPLSQSISGVPGDSSIRMAFGSDIGGMLVEPELTYTFRLALSRTQSAAGNLWAYYTNFDPTAFQEWSSFAAIFNEYRLRRVVVNYLPMANQSFGSTGPVSGVAPYVYTGFNMGSVGVAPVSINTVISLPNSKGLSLVPSYPDAHYKLDSEIITFMNFDNVINDGTLIPYAGAYGSVVGYGSSQGSTDTLQYLMSMEIEFRGRS